MPAQESRFQPQVETTDSPQNQQVTGDVGAQNASPTEVYNQNPAQTPMSPPPNQVPEKPETPGVSPEPAQPMQTEGQVSVAGSPKKGFPKALLIIPAILGIIFVIGYLVIKLNLLDFSLPTVTDEETSLTWWGLWEDEVVVSSLIAEFERQNEGIKINYIKQSPQDYRERLTNSLAKGDGPDIFRFHNTWVPMFNNELDIVPASVMNAAEFSSTFYPVASDDLASGTGFVGIPLEYDAMALFINEDIFASAGKTPPATWDDLRQLSKDLTTRDDQGQISQAGVALGGTENVDHWPEVLGLLMIQNGADPAKPIDDKAEDALRFYVNFASVDKVWDETLPPSTSAFAAGKLAMYFAPSWRVFEIERMNPNLNYRTVNVPQIPKDTPEQPDVTYATYWVEGVWTRSENKDTAWKFLEFMSSKESLEKFYASASNQRLFGEPYPRVDMQNLLLNHPILGSIISKANVGTSWYLASRTFDGPTGINSQIIKYYEDAVNAVVSGKDAESALKTVESGVSQVLTQYGI
jgi:multiple sugar transport system substrate-binding protein